MVQRTPGDARVADALTRVPDLPRWIDTRGMLLSGRAVVFADGSPAPPVRPADRAGPEDPAPPPPRARPVEGFVAAVPDAALAAIVGTPPAALIARAVASLAGDVNVLAQMEDADHAAAALPGWQRQRALIHVLADRPGWDEGLERGVRIFRRETAPGFDHVPDRLRRELLDALSGRTIARFVHGTVPPMPPTPSRASVPMAAAWADGRPVAFCYPVWQTETLWDVSIETLPAYRGRGLGGSAARALIAHMRSRGRAPVWGALESNAASRRLAARLGFLETAGIAVFSAAAAPATPAMPRRPPGSNPT